MAFNDDLCATKNVYEMMLILHLIKRPNQSKKQTLEGRKYMGVDVIYLPIFAIKEVVYSLSF